MKLFTIGYSGKSARVFFTLLKNAHVKKIIDIRLYNTSQLAGYTKQQDLDYLIREIISGEYVSLPQMAPTPELLDSFKKETIDWREYEKQFNDLIAQRQIEKLLSLPELDHACFLCSEAKPDHCHRRLVVEYLAKQWGHIEICHL